MISVVAPHSEMRHTDEHLNANLWQEQSNWSVDRGIFLAPLSLFFSSSLAMKYKHQGHLQLACAHLEGPDHHLIMFLLLLLQLWKFYVFTSVTGTLKKSRVRSRERSERRQGEGDIKLDLATAMLLHSLFTCCKLWLACVTHTGWLYGDEPAPFSSSSAASHYSKHGLSSYLSLSSSWS